MRVVGVIVADGVEKAYHGFEVELGWKCLFGHHGSILWMNGQQRPTSDNLNARFLWTGPIYRRLVQTIGRGGRIPNGTSGRLAGLAGALEPAVFVSLP